MTMGVDFYLHRLLRTLIPEADERIQITWKTFPITISYLLPLTVLAILVRRSNTYLIRLALLPIVVLLAIHGGFGYTWNEPELDAYNWISSFSAMANSVKALELGLARDRRRKISEMNGPRIEKPMLTTSEQPKLKFLPSWLSDVIDTITSLRGIGWEFGKDIYIPRDTRSMDRGVFLKQTLYRVLRNFVVLDIIFAFQALVPGLGTVHGGSIFFTSLAPVPRYIVATFLHFQSGIIIKGAIEMSYDVLTILGITLLNQSPSIWPSVFDHPWRADSLNDFWGKRWHQTQRQTFTTIGGVPGRFIGGEIGFVLGVFLMSGLYHEFAFYTIGRGWDNAVVMFFVYNGFGVILERLWRKVTGHRVGGWPGTLWTYLCIVGLGQSFSDSLHVRGLAGGSLVPASCSPIRRLLWPIVNAITGLNLR